jgi:hypothetical protein
MQATDDLAFYAIVLSALSVLGTLGVFAVEFLRYRREAPKLRLHATGDMEFFPKTGAFPDTYIVVSAVNVGGAQTTITNLTLVEYQGRGYLGRRSPPRYMMVVAPAIDAQSSLPHLLSPGTEWRGVAKQTADLRKAIAERRLWACVHTVSHSRPHYARVRPGLSQEVPGTAKTKKE